MFLLGCPHTVAVRPTSLPVISRGGGARNPYGSRILGPADPSPGALRVRVQALLTATLVVTNVVGAGPVFVISALVAPLPDATRATVVSLAGRALSAGRAIAARLATELPELPAGIGIATGEVVAGNVGHQ